MHSHRFVMELLHTVYNLGEYELHRPTWWEDIFPHGLFELSDIMLRVGQKLLLQLPRTVKYKLPIMEYNCV